MRLNEFTEQLVIEGSNDPWGEGRDQGYAAGTMNVSKSKYPEGSKEHKLYMTGYKQGVQAYNNKVKQHKKSSKEQSVAEAGRSYDDNRTGFSRGQRDDERHDLDVARPLIYGLKINGKIWQKDGNVVTFFTKERALAARNSILAKRPELEVGLVQRPQD